MNEFDDWALFEELGSRVMADLYAENSPRLGEASIRTRAFAAEGAKVTTFTDLEGLYFGLELEDDADIKDEKELEEWKLEKERVYEIQEVLPEGKLLARIIWPETKDVDPKAGTVWVVRPDCVDWVYDPDSFLSDRPDWKKQWNALQDSTNVRFGLDY